MCFLGLNQFYDAAFALGSYHQLFGVIGKIGLFRHEEPVFPLYAGVFAAVFGNYAFCRGQLAAADRHGLGLCGHIKELERIVD